MMKNIKARLRAVSDSLFGSESEASGEEEATPIVTDISQNMINLRSKYQNSSDFLTRQVEINGVSVALLMVEGMINLQTVSKMFVDPLFNHEFTLNEKNSTAERADEIYKFIENQSVLAVDMKDVFTCEEIFQFIMSGFVVLVIDGRPRATVFGMQGFSFRSISEPASEINERGSREGFTEPIRINMTMVRRRVKSPTLKFELLTLGKTSRTDICMIYMTDRVSPTLLREVRRKLQSIKLEMILTSGYIQPFLEGQPWSPFSDVGNTERPDVLAAKVSEGRIGILVDGTPYALIVPYLFTENFQSLDDYSHRAYYASFMRIIKYFAFTFTILLPALYVGIGTFHPELLPHALLFNIAAAEETTPFPLVIEALIIHLLYEIMREAGLRLPRPIGHAVSIVGALVIGDAAVSAGLIGSPMILVVAMTAISSFVVPSLYEPVSVLRFIFIILGGTFGLYGIALGAMLVMINICSLQGMGAMYMSPIAPFSTKAMRDTFIRVSFPVMQRRKAKIQTMRGMEMGGADQPNIDTQINTEGD